MTINLRKNALRCVCVLLAAFVAAPLRAQTNCTADASAAIECFVANAVATNLTAPRHGLTPTQFQAYGVAISQILHTHHSYLMLLATASSVADAMPPINASGTPNQAAQTAALDAIVAAELATGFVSLPQGVVRQDVQWFAEDVAAPMNNSQGYLQLLTPGAALRLLDTYVVAATTAGSGGAPSTVDWQKVETSISNAVDAFTSAGIILIPPGEASTKLKALLQDVAQIIFTYKTATGRANL